MDIINGFQIDEPSIFVSWNTNKDILNDIFKDRLHKVTDNYYTLERCKCLDGLKCNLGFHFDEKNGIIEKLEFFGDKKAYADYQRDLEKSFNNFQEHLEKIFGKPSYSRIGESKQKFKDYSWVFDSVGISHMVSLQSIEYVFIEKKK